MSFNVRTIFSVLAISAGCCSSAHAAIGISWTEGANTGASSDAAPPITGPAFSEQVPVHKDLRFRRPLRQSGGDLPPISPFDPIRSYVDVPEIKDPPEGNGGSDPAKLVLPDAGTSSGSRTPVDFNVFDLPIDYSSGVGGGLGSNGGFIPTDVATRSIPSPAGTVLLIIAAGAPGARRRR